MNKVIIVGGGAAGMMAAISASKERKTWQEAFYYGERQMQYYKCLPGRRISYPCGNKSKIFIQYIFAV